MNCARKLIGRLVYYRRDWLPTTAIDMNEWQKLGRRSSHRNVRIWVQADQADAGGAPNTIRFDHPWAEQQIAQIACPPETSIRCAFTQRLSSDSSEVSSPHRVVQIDS